KDERLAGVYSFAAIRSVSAADILPVRSSRSEAFWLDRVSSYRFGLQRRWYGDALQSRDTVCWLSIGRGRRLRLPQKEELEDFSGVQLRWAHRSDDLCSICFPDAWRVCFPREDLPAGWFWSDDDKAILAAVQWSHLKHNLITQAAGG